MLRLLNISKLAVVDKLAVEFRPGLNVLSGETGSGKSIIIDALGLLLGDRAAQEMIRTGAAKAFVEGVFDIKDNAQLLASLDEGGVPSDGQELIIRREIAVNGRSRVFVNDHPATLLLLKGIQPHVIDIHGQGEQQSLLLPEAQLKMYDGFSGAGERRAQVEVLYDRLLTLVRELESTQRTESERLQLIDILAHQIAEIDRLQLTPHEDLELEKERHRLTNSERLALLCQEVYGLIYDQEHSALARLGAAQRRLDELTKFDARFQPQLEQCASAKYALEEIAYFLNSYGEDIQVAPERLQTVADRLAEINRLKRKYGHTIDDILLKLAALTRQHTAILDANHELEQQALRLKGILDQYLGAARALTELRRKHAPTFETSLPVEFAAVALKQARFQLRLEPLETRQLSDKLSRFCRLNDLPAVGKYGLESGQFYFSANPGEELRPLSKVASGGELSRLMLVLKSLTAPTQFPKTLIFDEIDAGIGGSVADAVGLRLSRLSKHNQVLCVTHNAQIARYADAHYLVSKEFTRDRTITTVAELTQPEKIEELARMIGGTVTPLARQHAGELLQVQS